MSRVTAELRNGKIETRTAYSPWAADEAKSIPGAKWDKNAKAWTYPLSLLTCKRLRETYEDRLQVGARLSRWAKLEKLKEARQLRTGKAKDADLHIVPKDFPALAEAMEARPYQKSGTRFAADGRRVALLDEVGLGKTLIAIAGVIEAGNWEGDHLVIAKKTALESVWGDQLRKWTDGRATVFIAEGTQAKRKKVIAEYLASDAESKWLIINAAMLTTKKDKWCNKCKLWADEIPEDNLDHFTLAHKEVNKIRVQTYSELQTVAWRAILADEAHEYMSTAIKSKSDTTQTATGLLSLKTTPDVVRFALTGTPDRGLELNLWGLMHWLDPKRFSSKWAWVDHFFEKEENFFGFEIKGLRPEMRKEFWKMLEVRALRRTRAEVRPDIVANYPPMIEWVPLAGKHRKQYEELVELGRVDLKHGELQTQSIMAEFVRQQQLAWGEWDVKPNGMIVPTANSPKLDRLLDQLEERGIHPKGKGDFRVSTRHHKYIVASRFTQLIDFMEEHFNKRLGIETLKITGGVTAGRRTAAVRSFQEDANGPRILLLNTIAGGASITLDRHCDTIFAIDQTYKVDDQTQLFGRIDNRSVTGPESVPRSLIYIHTKDTIDLKMARNNAAQREMQHKLYDARRGVELARLVLEDE